VHVLKRGPFALQCCSIAVVFSFVREVFGSVLLALMACVGSNKERPRIQREHYVRIVLVGACCFGNVVCSV
jgi:hypothetical protein